METSPAAVNEAGRELVMAVSETEKRLEPEEVMLKRLPVVSPALPMLILTKSPEEVAGEEGSQLNRPKLPEVKPVEVETVFKRVPVVKVLVEPVLTSQSFPVVMEEEDM